jgi:hypothetical protein
MSKLNIPKQIKKESRKTKIPSTKVVPNKRKKDKKKERQEKNKWRDWL